MKHRWFAALTLVTAGALTLPAAPAHAAPIPLGPGAPLTPSTVLYEMNEAPGATVMFDSGLNHVNGTINPTGVQTGYVVDGATGYHWVRREPASLPAAPERVIQVPDNALLDPGSGTFTVEIRYRTKEKFGNIIQKGQSASKGGQWKIQNPKGIPSCLFKGSAGRVATQSKVALNDNLWHTLTCVKSATSVTMYVDGIYMNRKNGNAGVIDNAIPLTVGGKINCDQIEITCDYFSGQIDYVRLEHTP